MPGIYFIEIIVTMCQQLGMDDDVKYACLVAPEHHRLTDENVTIEVIRRIQYWVLVQQARSIFHNSFYTQDINLLAVEISGVPMLSVAQDLPM